jgi:hypothetical protein
MKNEKILIFGKYKIGPPSNHKAVSPGAEHAHIKYKRLATILRLQILKGVVRPRASECLSFCTCQNFGPQKCRNFSCNE